MFLEYADYRRQQDFSTDVVVVGTGAGGAVVGAELAEAGYRVVFVEEGSHHPTSSFNPYLTESVPRLYRDASATIIFGDPPIPYVEGRCVGGSTVINGGMAYRAPERVLEAWAHQTGSKDLSARALEPLFERVESRVSAQGQLHESVGRDSQLMIEGARRLGWSYSVNRRNQEACVGANNCTLGCPTGAKQSTLVSYVPRALAAGATFLTEVRAERLFIKNGRCAGLLGRAVNPETRRLDRTITLRARAVVVACGAVQTPLLLQRSGLGRRGPLGKNFLCHPNAKVVAVYPFDVEGWKGVSQAAQIREFHDEGLVFGENFVAPGAIAAHLPFVGDAAWELLQRYNQMVIGGVLVEDSTTGSVSSLFGMAHPVYQITRHDHARFVRGVKLLGQLHFEVGAELLVLPFENHPIVRSLDELNEACAAQRQPGELELFTVHLMGTARMGADPAESVVDLSGQSWELPGLYVADASLFPSAIGVNPQLTIMALATRVAERVELRAA